MIASHILGVTLHAVGGSGVPVLQSAALEVGPWDSNGSLSLEADGDLSVVGVYLDDNAGRAVLHEVTGAWCSEGAIVAARNNFVPALEVAAGNAHVLALLGSGSVWAWGANAAGQLGNGRFALSRVPVQSAASDVVRIRAGGDSSLAITARRTGLAWGENSLGQLGLAGATSSSHRSRTTAKFGATATIPVHPGAPSSA